jgi:uncharacterized protein (TIGR04255 family)
MACLSRDQRPTAGNCTGLVLSTGIGKHARANTQNMAAANAKSIPRKLKHDAIVEAVFEMRFRVTTTPEILPEILFGRLAEYNPWRSLTQRRMPLYGVPAAMREVDPNLRYQPFFELIDLEKPTRFVRIGPQALSYHRVAPYIGWERFQPELDEAVDGLFEKSNGLTIERLGIRYMNALRSDLHGIRSISDLDMKLEVAGDIVSGRANLNFTTAASAHTDCTVRVATTDFVQGDLPANTCVYVDIDVFTKLGFETRNSADVKAWVATAHTKEKEQFFRLLREDTIQALREA